MASLACPACRAVVSFDAQPTSILTTSGTTSRQLPHIEVDGTMRHRCGRYRGSSAFAQFKCFEMLGTHAASRVAVDGSRVQTE